MDESSGFLMIEDNTRGIETVKREAPEAGNMRAEPPPSAPPREAMQAANPFREDDEGEAPDEEPA